MQKKIIVLIVGVAIIGTIFFMAKNGNKPKVLIIKRQKTRKDCRYPQQKFQLKKFKSSIFTPPNNADLALRSANTR